MVKIKFILFLSITIFFAYLSSCMPLSYSSKNEYSASLLANEYALDITQGNKKYKDKYITVTGKISEQYKNKYQQNIILLMDINQRNGVKCILNMSSKQLKKPLKMGSQIKINGKCTGFNEYVILKNCIIFKN